jgi:hypothetical protein
MNDMSFDLLTRRASFMALGTAGLVAAVVNPIAAEAKRKKTKKKWDVNKLCKKQVGSCTTLVTSLCAGQADCLALFGCCPILGSCDITGFLTCFTEIIER